jgi:O-antigen/teichoic acid export membrane protein
VVFHKIKRYSAYLTLKPYESLTPEGRHRERYRLALWSSLANILSAGLSMATLLVMVPMTLPYLGTERFGVWMTISSIAAMLSFLDFGIGNGLINRVASANTREDPRKVQFAITHGLVILTVIGAVVAIVLLPLFERLPWDRLIKVKEAANGPEIRMSLLWFLAIFAASIPLGGAQKIFQGLQRSWQAHLVRGAASIVSLILVFELAKSGAGIPALLLATYGVQTLSPIFLIGVLYKKKMIRIDALGRHDDWFAETSILVRAGGLFFLLQVAGLLVWGIDSIIISATLGAASVTQFALVQRLFQFVIVPLSIVNTPLWAAYADARVRGDAPFIGKTLRRSMLGTLIAATASVLIISMASPWIFHIWIKTNAGKIAADVVWSYGLLSIILVVGNAFAMFLNGLGIVKSQVVTAIAFCMLAIPLKYVGAVHFGVFGLIVASIISYVLAVALPYLAVYESLLKNHASS